MFLWDLDMNIHGWFLLIMSCYVFCYKAYNNKYNSQKIDKNYTSGSIFRQICWKVISLPLISVVSTFLLHCIRLTNTPVPCVITSSEVSKYCSCKEINNSNTIFYYETTGNNCRWHISYKVSKVSKIQAVNANICRILGFINSSHNIEFPVQNFLLNYFEIFC